MTTTTDRRRALLAAIHILRKNLGILEHDYRAFLEAWTGKDSCADMDLVQLEAVARRLSQIRDTCINICGTGDAGPPSADRVNGAPSPARAPKDASDYPPGCTRPQWRKVRHLQRELRWDDQKLREYIRHVTQLDHERFLDVPAARQLIAGMTSVLNFETLKAHKAAKKKSYPCLGIKRG